MSPQIRYVFPEDDLPVAPSPLALDDDGGGWWSGVQRNFVAVPLAGALATVALSASLAFGYQQEELPQSLSGDEDRWSAPHVQAPRPVLTVFWANDELVPTPAALAAEDDAWSLPRPAPSVVRVLPPWGDDDVPAGSLFGVPEQDAWLVYTPPPVRPVLRLWAIEDEVTQAAVAAVPDELLWNVYTPPPATPRIFYPPDQDELPTAPLATVPEEDPTPRIAPVFARPIVWVWAVDDEIVPPPPVAFDEDGWPPLHPWSSRPRLAPRIWLADEEIIPAPAAPTVDEAYWQAPVIWRAERAPALAWVDDEFVPPPAVVAIDEDAAWPFVAQAPKPSVLFPWGQDEDAVPIPPTPLQVDEESWWPAPWHVLPSLIQQYSATLASPWLVTTGSADGGGEVPLPQPAVSVGSGPRPDLDALFDIFGVPAVVTMPGRSPVTTRALEIGPHVVPFPEDSGNWSLVKSRRRWALRLDHLGVTAVPIGTQITMGTLTVKIAATDYQDDEVAYLVEWKDGTT